MLLKVKDKDLLFSFFIGFFYIGKWDVTTVNESILKTVWKIREYGQ